MNSDMNESSEVTSDMPDQKVSYTLKVLFGPMFGCELTLPADDYFIIINQAATLSGKQESENAKANAAYANNTLYIPSFQQAPNILINLANTSTTKGSLKEFPVEVLDELRCYSAMVYENEIFSAESVRFAIKRSDVKWSDNINNFLLPSSQETSLKVDESLTRFYTKKRISLIVASFFLLLLIIAAGTVWYKQMEKSQVVVNLNHALSGAPADLHMYTGRKNSTIYVLTNKYQAFEWVKEALFKLNEKNLVIPIWMVKLQKVTVEKLINEGYPIVQIDFSDPQQPVITLWQEITDIKRAKLKNSLLEAAPFATNIKTLVKTKLELLKYAQQGLDRMHISYRLITSSEGYALVIRDALSDNALSAIRDFIDDFSRRFGVNIVNFSINLNENWLENKSYLASSKGYLFLNPYHWYYPLKPGETLNK